MLSATVDMLSTTVALSRWWTSNQQWVLSVWSIFGAGLQVTLDDYIVALNVLKLGRILNGSKIGLL